MNLRVRCCVFGGKKLKNLNGAPKFIIPKEVLRNLTGDRYLRSATSYLDLNVEYVEEWKKII